MSKPVCAIIGIGPGNGASFARKFDREGYAIALLSRSTDFSNELAKELQEAKAYACDAADPSAVADAFKKVRADLGEVDTLVYNAGSGSWKNVEEISPEEFELGWRINTLGALVASQQVIPAMKKAGAGNIIFIGATASLRGVPMTAGFAPAKAAQRILAQSMARHLWPAGIHVAVVIIDGGIRPQNADAPAKPDKLEPDDIALAVHGLTAQPASAWSFEIDLRPMREKW
ncbi:MAG: SDR family NAD(P)-dependent oxidoreductase [Woeseiaceae bacterium]|nr:SDR family NAD(P)-dependent oxidoreductase [Woeseiaceae bacterium]